MGTLKLQLWDGWVLCPFLERLIRDLTQEISFLARAPIKVSGVFERIRASPHSKGEHIQELLEKKSRKKKDGERKKKIIPTHTIMYEMSSLHYYTVTTLVRN